MKEFGERLRELRTENGLSSRELAKRLETTHVSIIKWENNKMEPSIVELKKIAVYFKVSADYLIGLED